MKKTTKYLNALVIALTISACSVPSDYNELKAENEKLKAENQELKNKVLNKNQDIAFIPLVSLNDYKLKKGEDLFLQVNLAWFYKDKNEVPIVVLWDSESKSYTDTLEYGKYHAHERKISTSTAGEYTIEGKVIFKVNGTEKSELFQTTYVVE